MIFLLKGFFDSLPTELFEAGQLDGAPETTLLARIAIPLTREGNDNPIRREE